MDGRRQRESLTDDAALDREIESALAVDPSPEFLAKVRRRVSEEPMHTTAFPVWRLAVAGAVMAVAMTAFVWTKTTFPSSMEQPKTSPLETSTRGGAPQRSDMARPDVQPVPPTGVIPATRTKTQAPRAARVRLPEVLIAENEKQGFALLVEELREGRDAAAIAEAASHRNTPGPPWLEIEPVTIEPLPQVNFEGVGQ